MNERPLSLLFTSLSPERANLKHTHMHSFSISLFLSLSIRVELNIIVEMHRNEAKKNAGENKEELKEGENSKGVVVEEEGANIRIASMEEKVHYHEGLFRF